MTDDLHDKLNELQNEYSRLKEENEKLKAQLKSPGISEGKIPFVPTEQKTSPYSQEEKIKIYRGLFRGRDDIYAVRWESKIGKSGYSPACANEWKANLCRKPEIKCGACSNREYMPLTNEVIYKHLTGKLTAGIYPLNIDETCFFLAIDFDEKSWKEDIIPVIQTCEELNIPVAVERSRSGNGVHVWIFFEDRMPASLARKLGSLILTYSMEKRYKIGFDSYDRFFPNQDTIPKGGFGNLIAIPLQKIPREKGNSVFIDSNFMPYSDQWSFLSSIEKMPIHQVNELVRKAMGENGVMGVKTVSFDTEEDDPWTLPPSKKIKDNPITGPLPSGVKIVQGNQIFIEKKDLSPVLINRLLRIAAFQNPEFYRAQVMRMSIFGKPRILHCSEDFTNYIGLPRGCLEETIELFESLGIKVSLEDERYEGKNIKARFHGGLTPKQKEAVRVLLKHDYGILSAGTSFGKTVVAANIIAKRKVNTLVLVHRRQLLDQWVERLSLFLGIPKETIGQIGSGKNNPKGIIDVGIMQSLCREGKVNDIVANYGQIVADECHHISAFSFEQIMKQVKAKYILGLTATPIRKDGHHPIIIMQCGPIWFKVSESEQSKSRPFTHTIIPRFTRFTIDMPTKDMPIHEIYSALIKSENRNKMILEDIVSAVKEKRNPLLLTERTEHLDYFASSLEGLCKNVFVFRGGMNNKQRKELFEKLNSVLADEERVILSTGRYIGEGFDDARLDTLFLAMPVSWKGTLSQYVGRLHRLYNNKKNVLVYDYVDDKIPQLSRMFERRKKGYKAIGYSMSANSGIKEGSDNLDLKL